jgi:hypothetical protein
MRSGFKISLLILACFVVATFVLFVVSGYERRRATSFLHEFERLQIGTSTFAEVQGLANRYGGKTTGTQLKAPCSTNDCSVAFDFRNPLDNHLQRELQVSLAAGVTVKEGRVTGRQLVYTIMAPASVDSMYILFDRPGPESYKGYAIKQVKPGVLEVDLGSNASAEIRRRAYAIDLGCLSSMNGCNSLKDVLPVGWSELERM